ncbi:MAG TPA: tannase/feruloyl esterase family alpha/beta hydrolase [Bryobacteraceae bacterium]|nr:tannase/feruloyl esterase family alpha/beta hydrolase [Bryobacteraceae bacterium]
MRLFFVTVFSAAALCGQGAGNVQFRDLAPLPATGKPAMACAELRALTSFDLSVISATVIPASANAPEHCRVSLMVPPEINIEVNLPTGWNGRLYMFGNGGWAGESFEAPNRINNRARGLTAGFVTAATDTGHSAAIEPGASFALNRQKLLDFGFRSLHVTAEAAKMIARAYYSAGPSKSYYDGCSQGGREGLILAQRFPNDFDAIIAGSPGLDNTGTMVARAYWMQGLAANPFPASKLGLLANRVYEQCDTKDGLKDGLIDDPRRCDFKTARDLPHCAEGNDGSDCFTTAQIAALDRIYGDVMSAGKRVFPGWPVGAEVAGPNGQSGWIGQQIPAANGPGAWTTFGQNFLRFMMPGAKPQDVSNSDLFARFDIDKDPARIGELRQILDAKDPDLSAFRRHGGKLLMYYGWADPQLNPMMGVEYYEQVTEKMGASTKDFARLYMVPGMFHCGGGIGTSVFDAATPLLKWEESGTAPDRIEASRVVSGKVVRTRPLCPYPQVARHKGSGSIDESANFACVNP